MQAAFRCAVWWSVHLETKQGKHIYTLVLVLAVIQGCGVLFYFLAVAFHALSVGKLPGFFGRDADTPAPAVEGKSSLRGIPRRSVHSACLLPAPAAPTPAASYTLLAVRGVLLRAAAGLLLSLGLVSDLSDAFH